MLANRVSEYLPLAQHVHKVPITPACLSGCLFNLSFRSSGFGASSWAFAVLIVLST